MENILLLFISIGVGLLLKNLNNFPKDSGKTLNLFVIYVSLPALILLKIRELPIDGEFFIPIIISWIIISFSALIVFFVAKYFNFSKETTGSLMLVVPLGNTSFVGVPMVSAFFGESFTSYALIYDQLGTFIALATYGSLITSIYGGQENPTPKLILKRVILFPPFTALIVAIALKPIVYPNAFSHILEILSLTLVPLALSSVGMQLELKVPSHELKPLLVGIFLKIILSPLIALIIVGLFFEYSDVAKVSIFEAGMGPMITAGAVAILANLAPRLTAAIVGYGIAASFVTLPILYLFLQFL